MYYLRVTVTLNLTFDLVFRIIISEHISYYLEYSNPKFGVNAYWDGGMF